MAKRCFGMGVVLRKKNYYQKKLLFNSLLQTGFCFGEFYKKWSFSTGGFLLGKRFTFLTFDLNNTIFFLKRFYFFVKRCSSFNLRFLIVLKDEFIFSSILKMFSLGVDKSLLTFLFQNQSLMRTLTENVPNVILFLSDRIELIKQLKNLGFPIIGFLKELSFNSFFLYPIFGNGGFSFVFFLWFFFFKSFKAGRFSLFRFMAHKRQLFLKDEKIKNNSNKKKIF